MERFVFVVVVLAALCVVWAARVVPVRDLSTPSELVAVPRAGRMALPDEAALISFARLRAELCGCFGGGDD